MARTRRSPWYSVVFGIFLALIMITAWEAASHHDGYVVTMVTDAESGEGHEVLIRDGRRRLEVEVLGEIRMTPGERGIEHMGPGAYLEIEEKQGRQRRRLQATLGPGGVPEISWFVDRRQVAFDDEARDWLAESVKKIYRTTGLDAEGRVERMLDSGGVRSVLREISRISSDSVARIYFEHLLSQAEVDDDEMARVLRRMARSIGSDHELRRLMESVPSAAVTDQATADAWLVATRSIGSDHELGRALGDFLDRDDLAAGGHEMLLEAALGIGSDHELGTFLRRVAGSHAFDAASRRAFDRALATIGSNHERQRVLAVLDGPT